MKKPAYLLITVVIFLVIMSVAALAATYQDGHITWTLPGGTTGSGGTFYYEGTDGSVSFAKPGSDYSDYTIDTVVYTHNDGAEQAETAVDNAGSVDLDQAGKYVLTPHYSTGGGPQTGSSITIYVGARDTGLDSIEVDDAEMVQSGSSYTAHVPEAATIGDIIVTAKDADATVKISSGGFSIEDIGSAQCQYDLGSASSLTFSLTITAANGKDSASYTLTVVNNKDTAKLTSLSSATSGAAISNLNVNHNNKTITGTLTVNKSSGSMSVNLTPSFSGVSLSSGGGSETNVAVGSVTNSKIPLAIADVAKDNIVFDIDVSSYDAAVTNTYTVVLTLSRSDTAAALTGLRVVGDNGKTYLAAGSFSATTYSYALTLGNNVDYLYVYPSYSGSNSISVKYPNGTVQYSSANGYYRVTVNDSSPGKITITATNGANSKTYTLNLSAAANDFDVSVKAVGSDGTTYLAKTEFDTDAKSYDLEMDDDVTYVDLYVYFDTGDYSVVVKYDGTTVSKKSSSTSGGYYLYRITVDMDDPGAITVKVTDKDTGDSATYTLYASEKSDSSASGTDELEGIYINTGTSYSSTSAKKIGLHPAFDSDITDYAVVVPYSSSVTYLNMRLSLADDDVDLEIAGDDISLSDDYYDYYFIISRGSSKTIEFTVDDVDYTLTVYAAASGADDDAYLDDLRFQTKVGTTTAAKNTAQKLSPEFDEDKTSYDLTLDADYSKLYLYAVADGDMLVLINDRLVSGSYWAFDPDDYDKITVTVYAEDMKKYTTYTVDLEERATLKSLSIYSGSNTKVTMSPTFSSSRYNYVANVGSGVSAISFYTSGEGTVKVSQNGGSYATKSSNTTSYKLNYGLNEFDILVGSTHYYVNVYRQNTTTSIVSSSQLISINDKTAKAIAAYNINGNNFVKLRDLAYMLSGTVKQFSVGYDSATKLITLRSGYSYTAVGGELTIPSSYKKAVISPQTVVLDSNYVYPMAYNIDGNNYFLLRDLAALFDFQIEFSKNTVYLYTAKSYGGESSSSSASAYFDVDMKITGSDGSTYLSTSGFDPEDTSYDLELDEDVTYLNLYVYFDDDDYTVSVKYDNSTVSKTSSSSSGGYYLYRVTVDTDDLADLKVTVKDDDGNSQIYTFELDVE